MTTVFDYNITEMEMATLNIEGREKYISKTTQRRALTDICQLLNHRNMGIKALELLMMWKCI